MILPRLMKRFLEIFFRLLYHQFSWLYDLVAWIVSFGQWKLWVRSLLPYLKSGNILEVGYGPGHLQVAAQSENRTIFGLDLSPQMAKIAQRRLSRAKTNPNIMIGDARALPFARQSFNQIIATFPTEYFLDPSTLSNFYSTLSSNGEIVLVPMAWIRGGNLIRRFLAWLFKFTGQSLEKDHPQFSIGEKMFNQAGFKVDWHTIEHQHSEVLLIVATKIEIDVSSRADQE